MGFLRILHRDSDLNPERSLGQVRPAQCSGFNLLPGSFLLYPWPQPLILPPHPRGPKLSANASIPKFQSEAGGCDLALSEGCTLNEGAVPGAAEPLSKLSPSRHSQGPLVLSALPGLNAL